MRSSIIGALIGSAYFALIPHFVLSDNPDATLSGVVASVAEGDMLTVKTELSRVAVRLADIDAPEVSQPFGAQSRESLSRLTLGKPIQCRENGRDRFGQPAWRCTVENLDVNAEQVRRGMAWAFTRYRNDEAMRRLQEEAQLAKRGLWRDPGPVAPWSWSTL
jgi:endonuclease YncB( thermonuclease family)